MKVFPKWHYGDSKVAAVDVGDEREETDCQVDGNLDGERPVLPES